ncbi:hypothetical protein ACRAVF_27070 [Bradyrhizobium oligotrophicum S58]
MTDSIATQELPSGAAMGAGGGRDVPSDAAAVHLSPLDQANLLAGQAAGCVISYLEGHTSASQLNAGIATVEVMALGCTDPVTTWLMQSVRMLVVAARGIVTADAAAAAGDSEAVIRREKWQIIAAGLVDLISFDSRMLIEHSQNERRATLARELEMLAEQNASAAEWGAAVAARAKRMDEIRRELHGDEPRG